MVYDTPSPPDQFSKLFSQQLESLRGISALIVLFTHCFQAFIAPFDQTIYPIIRLLGQSAVMMFFVLSGFLIGHSIQKNIHHFGGFNWVNYLKQRCKRILLPFIFALGLTGLLYSLAPHFFASGSREFVHQFGLMIRSEFTTSLSEFIGTSLFLNGFFTPTISANAALWSLSYEVWFYILAAFIPFLIPQRTSAILSSLVILSVLAFVNIQFLFYFLVWLSAFCLSFASVRKQIAAHIFPLKIIFLCLAIVIVFYDFYQFHFEFMGQFYSTENFTAFNVCIGLFFCCLILQLHTQNIQFKPKFVTSAQFSYTLYVTHFPLLLFIMGVFPQTLENGVLGGIIALILSFISLVIIAKWCAKLLEPQMRVRKS